MSIPPAPQSMNDFIEDGWRGLQGLLISLGERAQSNVTAAEFYAQLLDLVVEPLRLRGGVVWQRLGSGQVQAVCQHNPDAIGLIDDRESQRFHLAIVELVGRGREALLAAPRSTVQGIVNPTDCALVFAPVIVVGRAEYVLEFFTSDATADDSLAGLASMAEAIATQASEFHRAERERSLSEQVTSLQQLQQYALRVHGQFDLTTTAMTIVNDAPTVLPYDRAALLKVEGRRARLLAIGGSDGFDRRSDVVRNLERLASIAIAAGELEYPVGEELASEVEQPLQAYLDSAHLQAVRVLALRRPTPGDQADETNAPADVIGVLVLERFQGTDTVAPRPLLELFARHAAVALDNALLAHRWVWLRWASAWLGEQKVRTRQHAWRNWMLAGAALALVIVGLWPAEFRMAASGEMQPQVRRDLFAPLAGVVTEVHVREGDEVRTDAPLVTLRSPALELQLSENIGKRQAAEAALVSARALRLQVAASDAERTRAAAQEEELKATLKGIADQFAILQEQQQRLIVRSPQSGKVVTRDLARRLAGRPVEAGDLLMRVADVDGQWQLELELPEHRLQYLLDAQAAADDSLAVQYLIASAPRASYSAKLTSISDTAQLSADQRPMVPLVATLQGDTPAAARPAATVYAQIVCGRRPLAYVWLYDVWEAAKIYWWQ